MARHQMAFALVSAIAILTVCQLSVADDSILKITKTSIGCPTIAIADGVYRALDETDPNRRDALAAEAVKRYGCELFLPGEIIYLEVIAYEVWDDEV